MLNILYGWYLKNELSCVFDTMTFTENIAANTIKEFDISNAIYGDNKKIKLGTFNYIITRLFTASTGGIPLEVTVMPDGDVLDGFVSIVLTQREVEPPVPVVLTMDLKLNVINNTGAATDMFMVFEGFWIPRSLMPRFEELVDMVVTSPAKIDNQTLATAEAMEKQYESIRKRAAAEGVSMPPYHSRITRRREVRVPYCEPRRF